MKILIGSDTYPPDVNGASHFTHRLASSLASRGHDVHVAAPSPTGRPYTEMLDGVVVHRVTSHRYPLVIEFRICMPWQAGPELTRLVDEVRPDVVHVQNHFITGRFLAKECRRRGVALVATNHFMPENLVELAHIPRWAQHRASAWAWKDVERVFGAAHVVTAPTPRAVELLTASTSLPAQAVSCGIDTAPYAAAAEHASHDGPPVVLFVGRLDQEKRVNELIDAAALVPDHLPFRLQIVGEGSYRARWEQQVERLGLTERTEFLGFVSSERLIELYGGCDIFVMPGVAELQSLVTLEAMSAGKPVIAADAMALPHLVHHGDNGWLFQPGDATELSERLASLLADAELRQRMGARSRSIVAAHGLDATIDRFEQIYDEARHASGVAYSSSASSR